jgi:hypothetical protein
MHDNNVHFAGNVWPAWPAWPAWNDAEIAREWQL